MGAIADAVDAEDDLVGKGLCKPAKALLAFKDDPDFPKLKAALDASCDDYGTRAFMRVLDRLSVSIGRSTVSEHKAKTCCCYRTEPK